MKKLFSDALKDWSLFDLLLLTTAAVLLLALTIYDGVRDIIGVISALTGILYTLLAGKGKAFCYIFGIVNTILYGYVAYAGGVYGDMALNWLYYLPMMFVGLYTWSRHTEAATGGVFRKKLTTFQRMRIIGLTGIGWLVLWSLLDYSGGSSPILDGATTALSIAAMILGVMRCFEQWLAWTAVNTISLIMWFRLWQRGEGSLSTLIMWGVFLVCGIIFAIQWLQKSEEETTKEAEAAQ